MVKAITSSKETKAKSFIATPSNPQYKRYFTPMEVEQLLNEIVELKGLHIFFQRVSDGSIVEQYTIFSGLFKIVELLDHFPHHLMR